MITPRPTSNTRSGSTSTSSWLRTAPLVFVTVHLPARTSRSNPTRTALTTSPATSATVTSPVPASRAPTVTNSSGTTTASSSVTARTSTVTPLPAPTPAKPVVKPSRSPTRSTSNPVDDAIPERTPHHVGFFLFCRCAARGTLAHVPNRRTFRRCPAAAGAARPASYRVSVGNPGSARRVFRVGTGGGARRRSSDGGAYRQRLCGSRSPRRPIRADRRPGVARFRRGGRSRRLSARQRRARS